MLFSATGVEGGFQVKGEQKASTLLFLAWLLNKWPLMI